MLGLIYGTTSRGWWEGGDRGGDTQTSEAVVCKLIYMLSGCRINAHVVMVTVLGVDIVDCLSCSNEKAEYKNDNGKLTPFVGRS